MNNIIEKINKLMSDKKIKPSELSRRTQIPYSTLLDFLKGKVSKMNIERLKMISKELGCDLDYLMDDSITEVLPIPIDKKAYYLDDETARYAQEIASDRETKILFDAVKNIKKEDMKFVLDMIDRLKNN